VIAGSNPPFRQGYTLSEGVWRPEGWQRGLYWCQGGGNGPSWHPSPPMRGKGTVPSPYDYESVPSVALEGPSLALRASLILLRAA